MAGHRPRGVFHAFRLLLIIAVVATLLAAAARMPAAPSVPPAQHGTVFAAAPGPAEEPGTSTGLPAQSGTDRQSPPHREAPANAETTQRPTEAQPAPQRAPRACTGSIPFARAAAAGDALSYFGAPAQPRPDALAGLEQVLEQYLATLRGTYGVAVTDLATGATAAVRGDQVFVAASTFKVPLAMYVFSLVERGEADLAEPVYYAPEDWEAGTGILHGAIPGDCYTVAELVNLSLTVSDNIATNMLLRHFGDENVFAYMRQLGGTVTNLATGRRATTPRDMALYMELAYRRAAQPDGGLYRTLMGLLTQTVFADRIAAGAPAGVPVAHKIGTLPAMVHDIGVVFLPDRPYAIAIFSSGVNETAAAAALADITRIVSAYMRGGPELATQVAHSAASASVGTPPADAGPAAEGNSDDVAPGSGSGTSGDAGTGAGDTPAASAEPGAGHGPATGAEPGAGAKPPAHAGPGAGDGPPADGAPGSDGSTPDGSESGAGSDSGAATPAGAKPGPGMDGAGPAGAGAGGAPADAAPGGGARGVVPPGPGVPPGAGSEGTGGN